MPARTADIEPFDDEHHEHHRRCGYLLDPLAERAPLRNRAARTLRAAGFTSSQIAAVLHVSRAQGHRIAQPITQPEE